MDAKNVFLPKKSFYFSSIDIKGTRTELSFFKSVLKKQKEEIEKKPVF